MKSSILATKSSGFFLVTIFVAFVLPFFLTAHPYVQNLDLKFLPPIWNSDGAWPHFLGTDVLGRDLLARISFGAQLSLFMAMFSVLLGALIGIPLGLVSAFQGGWVDAVVSFLVTAQLSVPMILIAICIVAYLGPSLSHTMIAVGLVNIPFFIRVARSEMMKEKNKGYILAGKALGQSNFKIVLLGALPNMSSSLIAIMTLNMGSAILEIAGLSFLGLGAQPPSPEWGALILDGKASFFQAWWLVIFPGIAILIACLGFTQLGEELSRNSKIR